MRPAGIFCQWTQILVARIYRTSFQSSKIHEFRNKKKVKAFLINFSQFNNKPVVVFTTKIALNTQSPYTNSHFPLFSGCSKILLLHFQCLPGVPMFRTYKYPFCFPFRVQNDWTKTSLICTHRNQGWKPATTIVFAFYESSKHFKR